MMRRLRPATACIATPCIAIACIAIASNAIACVVITLSATRLSAQAAVDTSTSATSATGAGSVAWQPQVLGTQLNVIGQRLAAFHSPYAGTNSLVASGDRGISHVYGVYLGAQPFAWGAQGPRQTRLEAYLDIEMARGHGVSSATGLAGVTNGDVLRAGSADLGNGPYVARMFVRLVQPLGDGKQVDTLTRLPDQLASVHSAHRLEITAGKLAASDLFDLNRYANTTRSQFMNWSLFQNTAWDFAADTRGYTNGVAVTWVTPRWTLRAGSFQMPREANGNKFDSDLRRARGDNIELTYSPLGARAPIVRLLGFVNHARMGNYADALTLARRMDSVPDIVADDRPGRGKRGWGINVEQPLADKGETGAFLRVGWNDGANESFAFTEVDRHLSAGMQVSGVAWHRRNDRLGLAVVQHGIVAVHQRYLAAGGLGFLLGDGRLTYGHEEIFETYYRVQVGTSAQISPDVQIVRNPGYNRDRGPATVASVRVNLRY